MVRSLTSIDTFGGLPTDRRIYRYDVARIRPRSPDASRLLGRPNTAIILETWAIRITRRLMVREQYSMQRKSSGSAMQSSFGRLRGATRLLTFLMLTLPGTSDY